ncbi:MAG: cysteine desulfurase [Nanoarchaeota archaeon]|nr:cysteine desulfurase [Nanoarchaeota archaeon]
MNEKIYLDNAATTKVDKEVVDEMNKFHSDKYGNASSVHSLGQEARDAMEKARGIIAKSINAKPEEIYFTSGGTEANNWAIKGAVWKTEKKHVITTKIDHDCVLNASKWLEKQGIKVTYLDVDKEGFVDLEHLKKEISEDTAIVSVIHGNNEVGVIQDLEKIGKICRDKGVYFHTDACQSYTKTDIDVKKQNLDLVTLNAHKIHGPKGVGALYIRSGVEIDIFMHGGGHERKMRSGTENIPGIVGFGKSVELADKKNIKKMSEMRDRMIKKIIDKIDNVKLNGPEGYNRLCNNINLSFNNIEGEAIAEYLDGYGIQVSTGSACSSHTLEASHVLKAMGLDDLCANSSIRISLSKFNNEEEIDKVLEVLSDVVIKLRKISPFK